MERRVVELTQYSAKLEGRVAELERSVAERDERAGQTAREVEQKMREVSVMDASGREAAHRRRRRRTSLHIRAAVTTSLPSTIACI